MKSKRKDLLSELTFLLRTEICFMWDDTYTSGQLGIISKDLSLADVMTKV